MRLLLLNFIFLLNFALLFFDDIFGKRDVKETREFMGVGVVCCLCNDKRFLGGRVRCHRCILSQEVFA